MSRLLFIIVLFFNLLLFAQETTIKLPTTDNASSFNVTKSDDSSIFKLNADGGFYLKGIYNSGSIPISGAGTRLLWYPKKSAFRVGAINGTQWDDENTGTYSIAFGYNTTASGNYSTAYGYNVLASGDYSTAFGYQTTGSGVASVAFGAGSVASGHTSVAFGSATTADGIRAIAFGEHTTASGDNTTALGYYVSTNGNNGSFIIGDQSTTTVTNCDAANQMVMRFTGGYKLLGGGTLQNAGLIESTSGGFKFPDGTTQTSAAASATTSWTASGDDIYNSNSGNVGINESSPVAELHVGGNNGLLVEGSNFNGTILNLGTGNRMHFYPPKAAFRVGFAGGTDWDHDNIGLYSIAMGKSVSASGAESIAMGSLCSASGDRSIAMGTRVSTNGLSGAVIIGDNSSSSVTSSFGANTLKMRFDGGYRLWTNANESVGVGLASGGGSWVTISDSAKKENFLEADGEYFLESITKLRLGSWNYKEQDSEEYRHYGPMAQEIFHYFGHDNYGLIGNDTTLAQADMDGIIMIALKALERRTSRLGPINKKLEDINNKLKTENAALRSRLDKMEMVICDLKNTKDENREIREKLIKMEKLINDFILKSEEFSVVNNTGKD